MHKSQGSTLEKVCVDIGKKEFSFGITYVALSRVKDLENLFLVPFTKERYCKISDSSALKIKTEEWKRLMDLSN